MFLTKLKLWLFSTLCFKHFFLHVLLFVENWKSQRHLIWILKIVFICNILYISGFCEQNRNLQKVKINLAIWLWRRLNLRSGLLFKVVAQLPRFMWLQFGFIVKSRSWDFVKKPKKQVKVRNFPKMLCYCMTLRRQFLSVPTTRIFLAKKQSLGHNFWTSHSILTILVSNESSL